MTREERLQILGPDVAENLEAIADAAPPPTQEQLALLRRIFATKPPATRVAEAA